MYAPSRRHVRGAKNCPVRKAITRIERPHALLPHARRSPPARTFHVVNARVVRARTPRSALRSPFTDQLIVFTWKVRGGTIFPVRSITPGIRLTGLYTVRGKSVPPDHRATLRPSRFVNVHAGLRTSHSFHPVFMRVRADIDMRVLCMRDVRRAEGRSAREGDRRAACGRAAGGRGAPPSL